MGTEVRRILFDAARAGRMERGRGHGSAPTISRRCAVLRDRGRRRAILADPLTAERRGLAFCGRPRLGWGSQRRLVNTQGVRREQE
jgi:hypothetical protein